MKVCTLVVVFAIVGIFEVTGHGMLLNPVNRGSRWRYDHTAIADYNDNGNFCGGFYVSSQMTILQFQGPLRLTLLLSGSTQCQWGKVWTLW